MRTDDVFKLLWNLENDGVENTTDFCDLVLNIDDNIVFNYTSISNTGNNKAYRNALVSEIRENISEQPMSILYTGYYRTIIGIDNEKIYCKDSMSGKREPNVSCDKTVEISLDALAENKNINTIELIWLKSKVEDNDYKKDNDSSSISRMPEITKITKPIEMDPVFIMRDIYMKEKITSSNKEQS